MNQKSEALSCKIYFIGIIIFLIISVSIFCYVQDDFIILSKSNNIGTVILNSSKKINVKIVNLSLKTYSIEDILTGCDCIKTTLSKKRIGPFEIANISILFHGIQEGVFKRPLKISSTHYKSPHIIYYFGNVVDK